MLPCSLLIAAVFPQVESSQHISIQNTILWPGCAAAPLPPLRTQVFALHPRILTGNTHIHWSKNRCKEKVSVICIFSLTVPEQLVVMPHRPLSRTQSAPSYIHHYMHIHTQTLMYPHPIYHHPLPQETFQQHAPKKVRQKRTFCTQTQGSFSHALSLCKVPVRSVWPVSPGELGMDREETRETKCIPSQSPLVNCCSNQLGELHCGEYQDCQNRKYHQNLGRVHSSPVIFNRSQPSHLTSPLTRHVRSKPNYTTGRRKEGSNAVFIVI